MVSQSTLEHAYEEASAWAEDGYSEKSRAYWSGMRDTLAVILGKTTAMPSETGPGSDVAAVVMLSQEARHA